MIAAQIKAQLDFSQQRLKDEHKEAAYVTLQNLANDLATEFAATNDRFDFQRFLRACGF